MKFLSSTYQDHQGPTHNWSENFGSEGPPALVTRSLSNFPVLGYKEGSFLYFKKHLCAQVKAFLQQSRSQW